MTTPDDNVANSGSFVYLPMAPPELELMQGNCIASRPEYEGSRWQTPDVNALVDVLDADVDGELVPYTPCSLQLDAGLLVANSQLWLDGLHLEVYPSGAAVGPVIETSPASPQRLQLPPALWMTNVTVVGQTVGGERQGSVRGLRTVGTTALLHRAPPALNNTTAPRGIVPPHSFVFLATRTVMVVVRGRIFLHRCVI